MTKTKAANPFGSLEMGVLELVGWIKEVTRSHHTIARSKANMHKEYLIMNDKNDPLYINFTTSRLTFCLQDLLEDASGIIPKDGLLLMKKTRQWKKTY